MATLPTTERVSGEDGPQPSAKLETTLANGTLVRVEVMGPSDSEAIATRALAAASLEVARGGVAPRPSEPPSSYAGIVGAAAPMRDLCRLLQRIRGSNATILITGENGTGKELVARALHDQSTRTGKRFVATNCSAFNDNLLESELFGHRRGAFTGAIADKPGLFEVADHGTFFLDEVGDMSPALQVKLLRVLQEGIFLPVGATEQRKVDVRIIAATNRDLASMVARGTFREDLFYRLNVVSLHVPPLRDRIDDIPLLVQHFLDRLSKRDGRTKTLTQRTLARLMEHAWPGNVRELENEIERLWVLSGDDALISDDILSPSISRRTAGGPAVQPKTAPAPSLPTPKSLPEAVAALERRMIVEGLRRAKGNKTRAAEELGISRRNLIRKVQAYGLEGSSGRGPRHPNRDEP